MTTTPKIFKKPNGSQCHEGYYHHQGPHACDMENHDNDCPYWVAVAQHEETETKYSG